MKVSDYSLYVTLLKCFDVPEVLDVQLVPSEEVRMVPDTPTATKVLFPKVTPILKVARASKRRGACWKPFFPVVQVLGPAIY